MFRFLISLICDGENGEQPMTYNHVRDTSTDKPLLSYAVQSEALEDMARSAVKQDKWTLVGGLLFCPRCAREKAAKQAAGFMPVCKKCQYLLAGWQPEIGGGQ